MVLVNAMALPTRVGSRTTVTGHEIGRTYFSLRHRARYLVLGPATTWELAPLRSVRLQWDNGNCTISATPRGMDPEVCTTCQGLIDPGASLASRTCGCATVVAADSRSCQGEQ